MQYREWWRETEVKQDKWGIQTERGSHTGYIESEAKECTEWERKRQRNRREEEHRANRFISTVSQK